MWKFTNGIALLICLHFVFSASIVGKRSLTERDREDTVREANQWRAIMARKSNTSNMNEIHYDMDLEKKANKLTCETLVDGPDYMIVITPDDKGARLLFSSDGEQKKEFLSKKMAGVFVATQTGIGCRKFNPPCKGKRAAILNVCLVGPENKLVKSGVWGEPGANCTHGARDNGLCIVKSGGAESDDVPIKAELNAQSHSGNTKTFTSQYVFGAPVLVKRSLNNWERADVMKEANEIRAKLAKGASIANMNELVYDKILERKAELLTCQTMVDGPDYMTVMVPDEKGLDGIPHEQKMEFIMKKNLGLFMPTQTKIGCKKFDPPCQGALVNILSVCAVGPENKAEKFGVFGKPGSHCQHGSRGNGLCVNPLFVW